MNIACADLWGVESDTSANVIGFKYYGLAPVVSLLASKSSRKHSCLTRSFDIHTAVLSMWALEL